MNKMSKIQDRRYKLTDLQKETITSLKGESVSELARYYNVSRRTINFIQHPERKEKMLRARKDSGKSYYVKEKQRQSDLNTKAYREFLKAQGELK